MLPLPPQRLRERVGATTFPDDPIHERLVRKASWWDPDPAQSWLRQGAWLAGVLRDHLPAGTSLHGGRVLDFGCGAGRVLRHMRELVGDDGELHGVDIDRPSIDWLQRHASPPLHAACCDELPALPYPDDHFDLVYVLSVFTHIAEHWAGWLLELRRVLKPGGVLLATVIGRETSVELELAVPDCDAAGMYVRALGNEWDHGGPVVVHDAAWVAERWGRAFEIVSHARRATGDPWPHDIVVARAGSGEITEDELLVTGASGGEAEGAARAAQLRLMRRDALIRRNIHHHRVHEAIEACRRSREGVEARASARLAGLAQRYASLEAERASLEARGVRVSAARAAARLRRTAGDGGAA